MKTKEKINDVVCSIGSSEITHPKSKQNIFILDIINWTIKVALDCLRLPRSLRLSKII